MAAPKKRKSKAKRDSRRSHHAINGATMIDCPNCGEKMRLHRVCPSCGHYKGEEIVEVED